MKRQEGVRVWAAAVWLAVWQAAALALRLLYPHGALLLASPLDVLSALGRLCRTGGFWRTVLFSTARIFGGFLLSCLLACLLALAASRAPRVRQLMAPLVAAVKAVPVVSFIILALVWLDSPQLPLFIAGLMVFPPLYLGVLEGLDQADRQLLEMARVFRVPAPRQLRCIYLPGALPYFRAAAATALGLCWKAGVAAEVIGLTDGSIGARLYTAKVYFQTPELFAWTVTVVALSALIERLFLALTGVLAGKAERP